jgi:vancomycin resistance protein YoaR
MICTFLTLFLSPGVQGDPVLHATFEGKEYYFDLQKAGFDGIDPTTLNRQILHQWFNDIAKDINAQPQSARYDQRQIVPHLLGKQVNIAEMDTWPDLIHEYMGRPVQVPVKKLRPRLTTLELKMLKRHFLSAYTTRYSRRMSNRSHNLRLAAKSIDHIVVMPGETFSFNRIVGRRTVARGYREAKVIIKGEFGEDVGGGICQTSSTLYNSVDRAGLKILERVGHSRHVPYVPKNRDATVSWNGPDFRFVNQRNSPILIVSEVKDGKITILIFSS